nr:zinc finger, CCHC-type [Tanacetum cinerariifolium]
MLGFFGWLASTKQGMLEPVKVKCIFLGYREGMVSYQLWRLDDVTSKVVLYRNIGFNESMEYKKTFIGSGMVEPLRNVGQGAGSHKVQIQDVIYYHLARDREQHSAHELFKCGEDSNQTAFEVATVEKIYVHESLTFNDTVTYKVISKWKVVLKEDMVTQSVVYVLSNSCKESHDDSKGYC